MWCNMWLCRIREVVEVHADIHDLVIHTLASLSSPWGVRLG
jgi:hypothetical protein